MPEEAEEERPVAILLLALAAALVAIAREPSALLLSRIRSSLGPVDPALLFLPVPVLMEQRVITRLRSESRLKAAGLVLASLKAMVGPGVAAAAAQTGKPPARDLVARELPVRAIMAAMDLPTLTKQAAAVVALALRGKTQLHGPAEMEATACHLPLLGPPYSVRAAVAVPV